MDREGRPVELLDRSCLELLDPPPPGALVPQPDRLSTVNRLRAAVKDAGLVRILRAETVAKVKGGKGKKRRGQGEALLALTFRPTVANAMATVADGPLNDVVMAPGAYNM